MRLRRPRGGGEGGGFVVAGGLLGRLWQRDPTVWTGGDEGHWLGWLDVPDPDGAEVRRLEAFVDRVRRDGFVSAALLGMGDPASVPRCCSESSGRPEASSWACSLDRSGAAQNIRSDNRHRPDAFRGLEQVGQHARDQPAARALLRARAAAGRRRGAGARFVAVTDPARRSTVWQPNAGFRAVFHGEASIGGRYSACRTSASWRLRSSASTCRRCSPARKPWRRLVVPRPRPPAIPLFSSACCSGWRRAQAATRRRS